MEPCRKVGYNCSMKIVFISNLMGFSQRTIIVIKTKKAKIQIRNNKSVCCATIYVRKGIFTVDNALVWGNVIIKDA